MDIGSGRTTDAICRYVRYTRAYIYERPPQPLLIFVPVFPFMTLSQSLRAKQSVPVGTTKSRFPRPQLLLFPKLFPPSVVRGSSVSRKELFVINLLAGGRAIYLFGGLAPGNSLDQTQSFPFEWHARTSKL